MRQSDARKLYDRALAAARDDNVTGDEALRVLGLLVDLSEDLKEEEGIKCALQWCTRLQKEHWSEKQTALLHYYSSNAWEVFRVVTRPRDSLSDWEQPELEQSILHLRLAERFAERAKIEIQRRCQILTNLGNALSQYGRIVEAVWSWDRALEKDSNFGMARGNRGYELALYAALVHDSGHKAVLLAEAHHELRLALSLPLEGHAKQGFERLLKRIEKEAPARWLKRRAASLGGSVGRLKTERHYRKWCLTNRLFVNDLNDVGPFPVAAADVLMLPGLVVRIGEAPHFQGFFNQLKQEFVTARFLYYEGITTKKPHFSDRWVKLTNTLDYPAHSLSAEKVKLAFRSAYSLLDKIAFFLNRYLRIDLPDRAVSFRSLWYEGSGSVKRLRSQVHRKHNYPLRALFSLSKDLYETRAGFEDSTEPEARVIAELRNHLEHKYLKLHVIGGRTRPGEDDLSRAEPRDDLSRAEFESKALWLLRTARAALIYLSLAVHVEERERAKARAKKERIPPIWLPPLEDRWKI
jgi:hypothetical protein